MFERARFRASISQLTRGPNTRTVVAYAPYRFSGALGVGRDRLFTHVWVETSSGRSHQPTIVVQTIVGREGFAHETVRSTLSGGSRSSGSVLSFKSFIIRIQLA